MGFHESSVGKESTYNAGDPDLKICWRRDRLPTPVFMGFPGSSAGKESTCKAGDLGSIPGLGRSPGEGKGYPLQYSSLENSSPWGHKESDTTERLPVSGILKNPPANCKCHRGHGLIPGLGRSLGIENGDLLQYSCLKNSMDRGLVGYSPWGHKESGTTENTPTHITWIYHSLFMHSSTQGYLDCFQVLSIMSKAAINICVQVFVWR